MLSLNVADMQTHALELKKEIDSYEKCAMNIAQEMKNSEVEWHDHNSAKFFDAISNQKKEVEKLISELNTIKTKYNNIVTEAHKIASDMNKIFVNQSYKTIILSRYDTAIENLNRVKNNLNSQSLWFCTSYERNTVYGIASEIGKVASSLKKSKNRVETLLTKLNKLETNINVSLSNMVINLLPLVEVSEFMN